MSAPVSVADPLFILHCMIRSAGAGISTPEYTSVYSPVRACAYDLTDGGHTFLWDHHGTCYLDDLDEGLQLVHVELQVEPVRQPDTYCLHGAGIPLLWNTQTRMR